MPKKQVKTKDPSRMSIPLLALSAPLRPTCVKTIPDHPDGCCVRQTVCRLRALPSCISQSSSSVVRGVRLRFCRTRSRCRAWRCRFCSRRFARRASAAGPVDPAHAQRYCLPRSAVFSLWLANEGFLTMTVEKYEQGKDT